MAKADWDNVIKLWSHGRPESTLYVYRPVIAHFRNFVKQAPLDKITLEMLQAYMNLFKQQKPATVHRKMATIRSVLQFAHRLGVLAIDPGKLLRVPKVPDDLAQKILALKEIEKMIGMEPEQRNKILLKMLYCTAIRASEASGLRWMDCRERGKAGLITVLGKGNKKRSILLAPEVWKALEEMRPEMARNSDFVFTRRDGVSPLDRTRISHIVRDAARRAGLEAKATAHWMRHAHATHAMDHGAPLPLIAQTLGHASVATTSRYLHVNPEKSSGTYLHLKGALVR